MNRSTPEVGIQRKILFSVMLACFSMGGVLGGCGVKTPPVPPRSEPPPAVTDLAGTIEGDTIRLRWTLPAWEPDQDELVGFRIYRSRIPLSEVFCEDCPITFDLIDEVPITREHRETGIMTYTDRLEKGNRYIYRILPTTEQGLIGPESNVIRFTHS
ncbi:MAG: hypothetical protein ACOC23_02770 [Thermodesulfobacteriota bacterium]